MKDNKIYLLHVLDAINKIGEFTANISYENFVKNDLIQSAVIRQIEIIGEAANKLSFDLKDKYKNVPWQDVMGMRHKLIHGYFGVDVEIIWETLRKDVPILKRDVEKILKDLEDRNFS